MNLTENQNPFNSQKTEDGVVPVSSPVADNGVESTITEKKSVWSLFGKFVWKYKKTIAQVTVVSVLVYWANPFGVFDNQLVREFKIKLHNNEIVDKHLDEKNKLLASVNSDYSADTKALEEVQKNWFDTFKKVCGMHSQVNNLSLDESKMCSDSETNLYLKKLDKSCSDLFKKQTCTNKEKVQYIKSVDSNDFVVKFLDPSIITEAEAKSMDSATGTTISAINVNFSFDKLSSLIESNKSKPININVKQGEKIFNLNMSPTSEQIKALVRPSNIKVTGIEWHNTAVPVYASSSDSLYQKSVDNNFKDKTGKVLSWGNSVTEIFENHKNRLGAEYIGYHFIVLEDGSVINTRPVDLIASGDLCGSKQSAGKNGCRDSMSTSDQGNNFRFIQASFIGDGAPNKEQLASMKTLTKLIASKFNFTLNEYSLYSHNEFSTSKDPKENFLYWMNNGIESDELMMEAKVVKAKQEFLK